MRRDKNGVNVFGEFFQGWFHLGFHLDNGYIQRKLVGHPAPKSLQLGNGSHLKPVHHEGHPGKGGNVQKNLKSAIEISNPTGRLDFLAIRITNQRKQAASKKDAII